VSFSTCLSMKFAMSTRDLLEPLSLPKYPSSVACDFAQPLLLARVMSLFEEMTRSDYQRNLCGPKSAS
jgi:hypothetical protein